MTKNVKSLRKHSLLATAALLAMGAAPAAHAGDAGYGGFYSFGRYDGTPSQQLSLSDYITALTTPQLDTAAISSSADGVAYRSSTSGPTTQVGTQVALSQNSIAASAAGNQNRSSVDLGQSANQDGNLVGMIAGQVRSGASAVANVSNSTFNIRHEDGVVTPLFPIGITDPDASPSALLLSGNTATASTTLNESLSTVSGVLTMPIASGQSGSTFGSVTSLDGQNTSSEARGSVSVSTAQVNLDAGLAAGSRATLGSTTVLLDVLGSPSPSLGASMAVTDNVLAAQYTGNRASSSFDAQPGSAAFDGSVALSNLQSNETSGDRGDGYHGASAGLYGTSVTGDIRSRVGASSVLTGSLDVSGNTLSAVSTGNSATARSADGATVAGNSITYSGASLGGGTEDHGSSSADAWVDAVSGSAYGALALSNTQVNKGESLVSEISNGTVAAYANTLATAGTLAVDRNTIAAAATGNLAGNRIQADGTTIGTAATAAASNAQGNLDTGIAATLSGVSVAANVGAREVALSGVTSVSSNRISSLAAGNLADTQVGLSATTLGAVGEWAGADADIESNAYTSAYGGATAASVQANASGGVYSALEGATVAARIVDQSGTSRNTGVNAASISVDSNLLRSQAFGNDAATGVSLAAASGGASSAVANQQVNSSRIEAYTREAAVLATMGRTSGSTVGIEANTIAADAVGNRADNRVMATVTSLTPADVGWTEGYQESYTNRDEASTAAAHSIVSMQRNDEVVEARNTTEGTFARAALLGSNINTGNGIERAAAIDSSVTVKGNLATASATSNQVANTLGIEASAITSGGGYATPLAALSSTQVTQSEGSSTVRAGSPTGGAIMVGVQVDGYVDRSQLSVTDNTVSAVNLGNMASNRVGVTGTSYTTPSESGMTYALTGDPSAGSLQNDLSLLNNQVDNSNARSAITRAVTMGIDSAQSNRYNGIDNSTLSVAANRNLAEARNNNAVNTLSASGFATLTAGAGLLNTQQSSTEVSSSAHGRFRVRAPDAGAELSTLSVTDNATQALTVANSANNSAMISAVQLAPTSTSSDVQTISVTDIDPVRQGTGLNGEGALSSDATYALGNVQQHSGAVSASAAATNRVNLDSSTLANSTASITGNTIAGVAQSNSAVNSLALTSTSSSGVTGSVASIQDASGQVSATAGTPSDEGAFLVKSVLTAWTPMNVSNNVIRTSAGQNEAFNQQVVTGSTLSGGGRSSSVGEFNPAGGGAWVNADYAVLNQQTGSGSVTATAAPGQIGLLGVLGVIAPLTVSGNQVIATANVNTSSNALSLSTQGALGATGVVANAQTTQAGATSALVGGEGGTVLGTTIGYLDSATLAVSGNSLNAVAGGNNTSNVLNATGGTSTQGGGYEGTSFAVLNQQSNSASMNAAVQTATIGVGTGSYGAGILPVGFGIMNNSAASVLGNQVQAAAYGNTASNAVGVSSASGSTAMAGSALVNRQTNSANIAATVSGVTVGVAAGQAASSIVGVTGNSISAQAAGNSATNVMKIGR